MAELVIFDTALTTADRARVEKYLAAKWGISGVHRPVSQELTAVSSPLELSACAAWLDGADSTTLYTTDAGAVTAVSSPTEIAGCALWLDASDSSTISSTGGAVDQWRDKTANLRHFSATTTLRPSTGTRTQNGLNVIDFDGTKQMAGNAASLSLFRNASAGHVFLVQKMDVTSANQYVFTSSSGTNANVHRTQVFADGSGNFCVGGTRVDGDSLAFISQGAISTNLTLVSAHFDWANSDLFLRRDGVISSSTTTFLTNGSVSDTDSLASVIGGAGAGYRLDGFIAELIVFNTAITSAQRASVEAYLAAKWGIAGVHTPATATNDPVGYWGDKSGNARHAKQTTGSYRPKINLAGMNGERSVQFSGGNNELLSLGDLSAAFPYAGEVIVAFEPLSDTSYGLYETSANSSYFRNGGVSYFGAFSQSRQTAVSGSAPTTGKHIASIRCSSGGQQVVRIDGVQTFTGTPQGSGYLAGTSHVIGNNNNPAADTGLTGYIAEVICYNAILSDTDRARVEKYLQQKWGTPTVPDPTPPVGYWADKSGNARHATQSTAGSRPLVGSVNSRRALTFDGTDDCLSADIATTSLCSTAGGVAFYIAVPNSDSTWVAFSNSGPVGGIDRFSDNASYHGNFRATRFNSITSGAYSTTGAQLIVSRANASTGLQTIRKDGATIYSAAENIAGYRGLIATASVNVGCTVTSLGPPLVRAHFLAGSIPEILCYSSPLTDSQVARIERYLATRWGIALAPQVSNADAQDWINRVYANGGTVSSATAGAVNTLCDAIDAASLRDRFYRLNLFCGSNLNAALVPLYRGPSLGGTQYGNATDTNTGPFVSGDFADATGLAAGSGKYLRTGLTQASVGLACHLAFYDCVRPTNAYANRVGSRGATDTHEHALTSVDVATTIDYASSATAGNQRARATGYTQAGAFWLGVNPSATSAILYKNGVSAATTTPLARTAQNLDYWVFALNNNGSLDSSQTTGRSGGYSIGAAMDATQAAAYNAAMQAFQTALTRNAT
jgi:hypothetical protein